MTATSHDLAPQATVAPLPASACPAPRVWLISKSHRSCACHLSDVLSDFYATEWDGWIPAVVAPIRSTLGASS